MGAEIVEARLHTNWMDNGYPGSGFKGGWGKTRVSSKTFTTFDKTFAGLQKHNIYKIDPTYVSHTYHFITVIIGDLSIVRFCGHDCII